MANIKKITNKGGTSYKITVFSGRDADGKQIRKCLGGMLMTAVSGIDDWNTGF